MQQSLPVLRGIAALAAITAACFALRLGYPLVSFVYLIAVVLNSMDASFRSAALICLLAVACLDFFFIDPLFSLTVSNPVDILALVAFLITSLVVTRLASKARSEARIAKLRRQHMEQLYELARRLLALEPDAAFSATFLTPFLEVMAIKAACLFDGAAAEAHLAGSALHGLSERTREAYVFQRDRDDPSSGICLRCLRVGGKTIGAIGFQGLADPHPLAGPLAELAAAGLERAHAFHHANSARAQADTEVLRAAVLDALAHEFKTPLATILTAAGGLKEATPLRPEQAELATLVENEASRLADLTARLLRTARLDREELKPRAEPIHLEELVADSIERSKRQWPEWQFSCATTNAVCNVTADTEMLRLALNQLLDNACRYSPGGSTIDIGVETQPPFASVHITNSGHIPAAERSRIFERFYRGAEARRSAGGSGLGLYVARKIAQAHGGRLELDPEDPASNVVTFRLLLPCRTPGS
jgi:two-component system, OmpR family, sensor histidine kinase KdpD